MSRAETNSVRIKPSSPLVSESVTAKSRWMEFVELTKPKLSMMSIITALLGYFAARPPREIAVFLSLVVGTTLTAAGSAILNQWWERDEDSLMMRTRNRPLPRGAIGMPAALCMGLIFSAGGVAVLCLGTQLVVGLLALATMLIYITLYTPLKKVTPLATEIGAVPGAIPPLMGWMAAEGSVSALGWIIFGVLFTWQMPHFMAISWIYREDYRRGGFRVLALDNGGAKKISWSALLYTLLLIIITALPIFLALTGWIYAVGSTLVSAFIGWKAWQFFRAGDKDITARSLFNASIVHLPLLFVILVIDRWIF